MKGTIDIPVILTNGHMIEAVMPITDKWESYNFALKCEIVCIKSDVVEGPICFKKEWYNAPYNGAKDNGQILSAVSLLSIAISLTKIADKYCEKG